MTNESHFKIKRQITVSQFEDGSVSAYGWEWPSHTPLLRLNDVTAEDAVQYVSEQLRTERFVPLSDVIEALREPCERGEDPGYKLRDAASFIEDKFGKEQ